MTLLLNIWDNHSAEKSQEICDAAELLGLKCIGHNEYDMSKGYRLMFATSLENVNQNPDVDWGIYKDETDMLFNAQKGCIAINDNGFYVPIEDEEQTNTTEETGNE